jgi:uncharacterized membrane protein YfcA
VNVPDMLPTGIQTPHQIALLLISVLLLGLVLELVRQGHLKERYALLWLAVSGCGLVVGIFPNSLVMISRLFNLQLLTVLFFFFFLLILGLVLSFSVVISRLAERNRRLTQEVALLAQRLDQVEKKHES